MINGLVVVLFIVILLLVLTVVEQADTIKRLSTHNVSLINAINKRVKLPALSVKDVENIDSLLNELNSGIGFLELSGHLKTDKAKIELLKRTLNHYIVKSPSEDDEYQHHVLLKESMRKIFRELADDGNDWEYLDFDNKEIISEVTKSSLHTIKSMRRALNRCAKERRM